MKKPYLPPSLTLHLVTRPDLITTSNPQATDQPSSGDPQLTPPRTSDSDWDAYRN